MNISQESNSTQENSSKLKELDPFIQENQTNEKIYDKITEEYGYGWEVWKIILATFCIMTVSGYCSNVFSILVIAYKEIFNLTDANISLIGMLFFIGKITGSLSIGYLTSKWDRRIIALISTILIFTINLVEGLWLNYYFFVSFRVVTGFLSRCIDVISINTLCEYLPKKNRSLVLNMIWCSYAFAPIFLALTMKYTMPNIQASGIRSTLLIYDAIILLTLIAQCIFLKNSPRYLILNGKEKEAFNNLCNYKNTNEV